MKLRIILSLLFLIATTFISIHEIEHISHPDDAPCFVCQLGDNLSCCDDIEKVTEVEIIHFEKIVQNTQIIKLHLQENSNQTRAPPALS